MDGTLVDSTEGVVGAWNTFAVTYPHLNVQEILSSMSLLFFSSCHEQIVNPMPPTKLEASHGIRTIDNLRKHCGIQDPLELEVRLALFTDYN